MRIDVAAASPTPEPGRTTTRYHSAMKNLSSAPIAGPLRLIGLTVAMGLGLAACALPDPYTPRAPTNPANDPTTNRPGADTFPAAPTQSNEPVKPLPPATPQRTFALGAATRALVDQAHTQSNAGNTTLAAATVERALRIEADNPLLWIELARIRQDEGNSAQAENLARKALAMASGDGRTQAAAWKVIAESYRARGRNPEAREADARATALAQTVRR
jgi:tetratricopeptide (TPR) repeat protein